MTHIIYLIGVHFPSLVTLPALLTNLLFLERTLLIFIYYAKRQRLSHLVTGLLLTLILDFFELDVISVFPLSASLFKIIMRALSHLVNFLDLIQLS